MAKRKRLLSDAELKAKQRERGRKLYLSQKYQDDIELAQQEALNRGWIDYPKGEVIATDYLGELIYKFSDIYNHETHENLTYGDDTEMHSLKTNAIIRFENIFNNIPEEKLKEYLDKINSRIERIDNLLTKLQYLWYDSDDGTDDENSDKHLSQARGIISALTDIILNI